MDIRVPRLAEGVEAATVVNILVSQGDQIQQDQTIMELETEKAVGPIPSPGSGTVAKIHVKEGDKVAVGQLLISLSEANAQEATAPAAAEKTAAAKGPVIPETPSAEAYRYQSKSGYPPPAPPSLRKMAGQLGIDLTRVKGREKGGRITLEDVRAYLQRLQQVAFEGAAARERPAPKSVDFSRWGPVKKTRMSALRRTVAEKMVESWTSIPHVTQFDEADVSSLLALRKKYSPLYEKNGARLTLTSFALKAVVTALKKFPIFNSSVDEAAQEIIYKEYFHIGVAVDTESGLIVPVLRDVDQKSLLELSLELSTLAEKSRERKISLEELQGGTFTISNLGGIGGAHFTPIIYKPQVSVIAMGRGLAKPVARGERVEIRTMLPLGLSYDHRVIDGADGARFIRELVVALENFPEEALKL